MEHPLIRARLLRQDGVVAVWQLVADGVPEGAIRHATERLRPIHDGVYISGHGRVTEHQRLLAAALTTPSTYVDRWSAACFYGLRSSDTGPVTVVRPGTGGVRKVAARVLSVDQADAPPVDGRVAGGTVVDGARADGPGVGRAVHGARADRPAVARAVDGARAGGPVSSQPEAGRPRPDPRHALSVRHSGSLPEDDLVVNDGIAMVSGARTVLDLLGLLRRVDAKDRLVREALRLGVATATDLHAVVARHPGRRGVADLKSLADRYAKLPTTKAKSDAELLAVALLVEAGFPKPQLNVLVAGQEGDLVFTADRHIVELDSDEYHPFPERDEIKRRIWENAGWSVDQVATNDVYVAPHRLFAAARPPKHRS